MARSEKSDYITERTLAGIGIGLVLVFAFMGLWVYRGARCMAQSSACYSNLLDLRSALTSYAEDHNGLYPPPEKWNNALGPYVKDKNALRCPGVDGERPTYAMNISLKGRGVKSITDARNTVVLFESVPGRNLAGGPELLPERPRHGVYNLLFADGHVKHCVPRDIHKLSAWGSKEASFGR